MPLTDREKQILRDIERQLRDDGTHADGPVSSRATHTRRIRLGIGSFLAGLGILIAFFVTESPLVGVLAFIAMVAGVVLIAGGATRLAAQELDRLRPKERALGSFRRWERGLRDRFKRS